MILLAFLKNLCYNRLLKLLVLLIQTKHYTVVKITNFWESEISKIPRSFLKPRSYTIVFRVWKVLWGPQQIQDEAIKEWRSSESLWMLCSDASCALFNTNILPTDGKFSFLLPFWTTASFNRFCAFCASRKISSVLNAKSYPNIICKKDHRRQNWVHKIVYAFLSQLFFNNPNENPNIVAPSPVKIIVRHM